MSLPLDCLFCKFVAGTLATEIVAQNERAIAFRDINPQAPVHVLVIPREHYADVATLAAADPQALADLIELAQEVALDEADGEYRLIFNSGPLAGQSVFHVHGHVLGGRKLGWTPA
ncbi:MAG: histidine triad nucleotide-binding protein [Bifidobacteriaceae bacterium]|jgi:histidine triad (HIT) family protein|nr:histidine triad nucleotide-binding protein [Bifidobacteriaceae bacterium]